MAEGPIHDKSFAFALRVVRVTKQLQGEQREFVLSRQFMRSGTAIGALVREAAYAESKADFAHKMNIALKEANETIYWLDLLRLSEYIGADIFEPMRSESEELVKLLISIVKTSKGA